MLKQALIIDGGKNYMHSQGKLNHSLSKFAADLLKASPHWEADITCVDAPYDPNTEVEKILKADLILWQTPAWWMGVPWTVKKYIDEVFTTGHEKLYRNDGRTRSNPLKKYGSGGLLSHKYYMLSVTWNAPEEAFRDPTQFFEGKGVDAVYFPLHKANQFLGLKALPTFMLNDVIKDPQIEQDMARYKKHLEQFIYSL